MAESPDHLPIGARIMILADGIRVLRWMQRRRKNQVGDKTPQDAAQVKASLVVVAFQMVKMDILVFIMIDPSRSGLLT